MILKWLYIYRWMSEITKEDGIGNEYIKSSRHIISIVGSWFRWFWHVKGISRSKSNE